MEGSFFASDKLQKSNVEGTNTEVEWVIQSLNEKNEAFKDARGDSRVSQIDSFDVSSGRGFISKVYKLTIHFDDKTKEPFVCVLKIPGSDCVNEAVNIQNIELLEGKVEVIEKQLVANFHNRECQFYRTYTNIPDLKIVKCHGARDLIVDIQEGALLMDYLGSTGTHIEFVYGLNVYQIRNILKEIHNLQAYFFSLPNQEWYSKFTTVLCAEEFEKMGDIYTSNWNTVKKFVPTEMYEDYEVEIQAITTNNTIISNFMLKELPMMKGSMKSIVHSDLWINNIIFKKDGSGAPLNEVDAIIDWQLPCIGSIGSDLARSIVIGCQPEIRREIETVDLPKYYENIKNEVIKRGGKFEMSWEMFKLNYDYCMIDQAMQLVLVYGFAILNYNIPEDRSDYMWNARNHAIGSRIVLAMKDAVTKCRVLKPEWLIPNYKPQ
uniref:CHK domain-containing protein n=1 Tax=Rhabditophanes sp. KR3021 TaxID=114890 RepID=A0AC35TFR2_9BILA